MINAHLGAAFSRRLVGTTEDEQAALSDQIVRLRRPVLAHAAHLLRLAAPPVDVDNPAVDPWRTVRACAQIADEAVRADSAPALNDDDLHPSHFRMVDAWRRAAIAAVTLSEQELPALGAITSAQRRTLAYDADLIVQTVRRLDARWRSSGRLNRWTPLPGRLAHKDMARAAAEMRAQIAWAGWDTSIDHLGYSTSGPRPVGAPADETSWLLARLTQALDASLPSAAAAIATAHTLASISETMRTVLPDDRNWTRRARNLHTLRDALRATHSLAGSGAGGQIAAEADAAFTPGAVLEVDSDTLGAVVDGTARSLAVAARRALDTNVYAIMVGRRLGPTVRGVRQAIATFHLIDEVNHPDLYAALDAITSGPAPFRPGDDATRAALAAALVPTSTPRPGGTRPPLVPRGPVPGAITAGALPGSSPVGIGIAGPV